MFTPNPITTALGHAAWIAASVYVAGPPGVPRIVPFEHVTVRVDQNSPASTSHCCHAFGTIGPWAGFWYGSNTSVVNPLVPFRNAITWYAGAAIGGEPAFCFV